MTDSNSISTSNDPSNVSKMDKYSTITDNLLSQEECINIILRDIENELENKGEITKDDDYYKRLVHIKCCLIGTKIIMRNSLQFIKNNKSLLTPSQ